MYAGKARISLLVDLRNFFSDLGWGERKKKALKNYQLTGHFQSFFFSFSEFFFNISRKNSKTSEVNQQSVLNLYIFHYFPKNLHRTVTLNSVTLKNTQTEPQKYIILFNLTNDI